MDPEPLDEEGGDEPTGSSAAMPSMSAPSEKEKEEHFVSHFPFRAWCEHCVRGKAKAMRHVKVDHSEEQVPVISGSHVFMHGARFSGSSLNGPTAVGVRSGRGFTSFFCFKGPSKHHRPRHSNNP